MPVGKGSFSSSMSRCRKTQRVVVVIELLSPFPILTSSCRSVVHFAPSMFSVSQLSRYLKEVLDTDDILQDVWARGEISGCKLHAASGHCYFTLKDADAQLACVVFKPYRVHSAAPELRDGMAIAANGHISFYERDGKLQLYVERVEPIGDGALFQRFAQPKAHLEAEGLFEEDRKRPLPAQPSVIGIVTSPQAAALQDMLRVLAARAGGSENLRAMGGPATRAPPRGRTSRR